MSNHISRHRLQLLTALSAGIVAVTCLFCPSLAETQNAQPTGVLRLRVRVKVDETTKGLARKRFYLIKGTLEQNTAVLGAAKGRPVISRDCYYTKLGASPALMEWLKAGDCESVYCREVDREFLAGPKAVPEFATAYVAGQKEFGGVDTSRKWLTNNLTPQLRDGFYQQQRAALQSLIKQAESQSGATVQSVMTDRNGTAYFTDLIPGTYVLTNFLPVEIGSSATSWTCEVQIKPGDIATEKPFLVSNRKDKNVKCVAVEAPLPACN
jgi:hypothetical protein